MGSKMEALDWGVGYGRSWWWRHHNDVNDVVLVSLLFHLDMLCATVCCFRFWLWACRCLWGIICCKHVFLLFLEKFWFCYRLISFMNKILRKYWKPLKYCLNLILYISILMLYANYFWFDEIVLKLSVEIEEKSGLKPSSNQYLSVCHWILKSISALNYIKVLLLRAYISSHKFDVTCISETWLWYIWWWQQSKNCRLQFGLGRSSI